MNTENQDVGSQSPVNENCLAGFRCLQCGSLGPFRILVTSRAFCEVSDDGFEFCGGDAEWDFDSECRCTSCGMSGVVADFVELIAESSLVIDCIPVEAAGLQIAGPDLVRLTISRACLAKVARLCSLMAEDGLSRVDIKDPFDWELFCSDHYLYSDGCPSDPEPTSIDGKKYWPFDIEAPVGKVTLSINADGKLKAIFVVGNDEGDFWCDLGSLPELTAGS